MEIKLQEHSREEILGAIKNFRMDSFHEKVASKVSVEDFYVEAIRLSGIVDRINRSSKTLTLVDIGGGGGRIGEILDEYAKKGIIKKEFNYVVVDLSRVELGKGNSESKLVGDMSNLHIRDSQADAVFLLNMPSTVGVITEYIKGLKPTDPVEAEKNKKVRALLEAANGNINFLNYLEAARILKEGGVLVWGRPTHEENRADLEEMFRRIQKGYRDKKIKIGGIPLRKIEKELVGLDKGVVNLWRYYGIDIDKPEFYLESARRTHEKVDTWMFYFNGSLGGFLNDLSEEERFWEIIDEMKKAKTKV
jgi:SAM-dependent methyltransferase